MAMLAPAILLVTVMMMAQVPPALRPEGSQGNAHFMIAWPYTETNSVLGGRFVLVDTLRANVKSAVSPAGDSGGFRYSYSIVQSRNSTGKIDEVTIGPLSVRPTGISSPEHWGSETREDAGGVTVTWMPELGPPPQGWVDDGVDVYPSAYSIPPGDSLSGFAFTARGVTDIMAGARIELQVWQPLRSVEEAWIPECPYRATGRVAGPGVRR